MTESEIVMSREPHVVPPNPVLHSTEVTDIADITNTNCVKAWKNIHISIKPADKDDEVCTGTPTTPPTASEMSTREMGGVSTNEEPTSLSISQHAHVYPKTPPASCKFHSPSTKLEKGNHYPVSRSGDQEELEDEYSDSEGRGSESAMKEEDKDIMHVLLTSPRSHSLPVGIKLQVNRNSSNSDETFESEGGSPLEKRKCMRHLDHLIQQERFDSAGSDFSPPESSDESSSDGVDEDKMFKDGNDIPASEHEHEDDMFINGEVSHMREKANTKLVNWAHNDFIPACHQLLSQCSQSTKSAQIKSANIQASLRSLSNTITFFCSEQQQRLSQVFELVPAKPTASIDAATMLTYRRPMRNMVEGHTEDASGDRSYAVKVLRSASQSLIAPLLVEASQRAGFTPALHQAIIKALQKISWKVEACVSFSNPNHSVEIHSQIFDAQHSENVKELMIQALPPAEPNLRTVPPPIKQRKASAPTISSEEFHVSKPMRRGQSVKEKIVAEVLLETDAILSDLQNIGETEGDDEVWNNDGEREREGEEREWGGEGDGEVTNEEMQHTEPRDEKLVEVSVERLSTSPLRGEDYQEDIPNLPRRERIATEGEADLVNKLPLRRVKNFGSIPNLDSEGGSSDGLNDSGSSSKGVRERYFRPRAFRRTTISLSKKEVRTLGLTVAKRVDDSIMHDIQVQGEKEEEQKRSCKQDRGSNSEEKAPQTTGGNAASGQLLELQARNPSEKAQVPNKADKTRIQQFDRIRSVSMSDILDCDMESLPDVSSTPDPSNSDRESDVFSPQHTQRLELVPFDKQPLHIDSNSHVTSPSSQPTSPNYHNSYTPVRRGTQISTSSSSDWVMVESEKRKKLSMKGRAKATVKKSISSSGKFAHSLLKTAKSLRHSSVMKLQQQKMSKSLSAADLLDESAPMYPPQQNASTSSRFSVSIAHSPSAYDAATLPNRSKRINTFTRIIRRGKDPQSSSFGKLDNQDSAGLSTWRQEDFGGDRSFAESIESVSRNAIHSMAIEGEEQLLISVDMATKLQKKQAIRSRSSSGKDSSSNPWFQISVNTNIKLFGRQDYIILRPFKQIQTLIDSLSSSHGAIDLHVPRLDKKSGARKQMKGMEDLLRSIAGNSQLRNNPAFVNFLMPDDQFGSFTESDHSEVNFVRLMTFYTPDLSSGPPGSFPSVQVVPAEHVPATPSVDVPHKSSITGGHKKGSMHYMKKDGKEDTSTFVIQEEGEDALIVAHEGDHYVVVAGTFEKLVEQLACEEKPDARFVTTFLLGYRHFATTLDFLTTLLERFHMRLPPNPTEEEMAYAEKWSYVIQLRVLDILTYWMKKCWPDIYRHPPVLEKLKEFAASLRATDDHNFQYAGTNIEKIIADKMAHSVQYCLPPEVNSPSFTSSLSPTSSSRDHHHLTVSPLGTGSPTQGHDEHSKRAALGVPHSAPGTLRRGRPAVKRIGSGGCFGGVDICTLPAIQLARQMTLIELEFLRAIDIHELVVFTWDPNTPENKPYRRNLDAFIERFNKVSYWVASEICCVEDVRLRGILLEKFIEVAKHCHEFKNYNTAISVLSGLSLAAVRRLKRSWDLVNEKTRKWFTKLQPLTSPTTNHRNYRRALATVHRRDACIPYLGVFMRDLTFFNDGNTKRLKNGLYNFSKLRTMVYKFEELKRYQRSKYFFPPEDKIREFCRNLWCLSESELYDTSLQTEPREETDI